MIGSTNSNPHPSEHSGRFCHGRILISPLPGQNLLPILCAERGELGRVAMENVGAVLAWLSVGCVMASRTDGHGRGVKFLGRTMLGSCLPGIVWKFRILYRTVLQTSRKWLFEWLDTISKEMVDLASLSRVGML